MPAAVKPPSAIRHSRRAITSLNYVAQAVVLFPSAKQAGAFFTASAKQWPACRKYTHTQTNSL